MTTRWQQVAQIFESAVSRAPADRAAFVHAACRDDSALRREVESLLAEEHAPLLLDASIAAAAHALLGDNSAVMTGQTIGAFEIDALLGAGGMGEVYRARDTRLGRDVAIKFLPNAFASNAERLARFTREAQLLASLNHPQIGAIYGFEDAGGVPALVLELVEGPTLADRIARGALSIDEALGIAGQIADALQAAHEQGIVHRDLKPANIKVREDGTVKVLDFGLAKMLEPTWSAGGSVPLTTQSPTITTPSMTAAGMILGTAAYMSPEQARGRPADKRSDIWAFGCVLYEMLTARRAFDGEDVTETLAAILRTEPDYHALPLAVPRPLRTLIERCLRKDHRRRLADIADARLELDDALNERLLPADPPNRVRRFECYGWLAALAAAVATTFVAARPTPTRIAAAREELRLSIATPPTSDAISFALSPNGRRVVFAAGEGMPRLWLRSLDDFSSRPLPGTEGAELPFWSPDGRSIAFFAGRALRRLDLTGGAPPTILAAAPGAVGGSWGADDTILFTRSGVDAIWRMPAAGGSPVRVTALRGSDEVGHQFPEWLPDGRHFIYYVNGDERIAGTYVGTLDGTPSRRLAQTEGRAAVTARALVFVRGGALLAQRYDPRTFQLIGDPTTLADRVAGAAVFNTGRALAATLNGAIAFRSGDAPPPRQMLVFDRAGAELARLGEPDTTVMRNPQLAPDGSRLAVSRGFAAQSLWFLDVALGRMTRLPSASASRALPVWSPDGRRIAFLSDRNGVGTTDLFVAPVTGDVRDELIFRSAELKAPLDWSPDGKWLLFTTTKLDEAKADIWAVEVGDDHRAVPVIKTPFHSRAGQFSPDGRWVAYDSDESGNRVDVYVQPFPGPGEKRIVSSAGGAQPRWRHDGKELFYIGLDGRLMAVPLSASADGASLRPGAAAPLFAVRVPGGPLQRSSNRQQYAVSHDGQRFYVVSLVGEPINPISVILNWEPR